MGSLRRRSPTPRRTRRPNHPNPRALRAERIMRRCVGSMVDCVTHAPTPRRRTHSPAPHSVRRPSRSNWQRWSASRPARCCNGPIVGSLRRRSPTPRRTRRPNHPNPRTLRAERIMRRYWPNGGRQRNTFTHSTPHEAATPP